MVRDAFGYRQYGAEQESNSTEDSKRKDRFEDKWVKRCGTETDNACAAEEVNGKNC